MFNAPRPGVRYNTNLGASFVDDNPLSSSSYDGLDPWSATPSPVTTPPPPAVPSIFSNVIADATAPPVYNKAFQAVDPSFSGEVSVNSLHRVLSTSGLSATTIDRIVNLVSSRPRVSKLEFFIALALVALAQLGKDLSIEQVAALASQSSLPEPSLDLSSLTSSAFSPNAPSLSGTLPSNTSGDAPTVFSSGVLSPAPQYSSDDPWNTAFRSSQGHVNGSTAATVTSLSGGGLPPDWWKRQESVIVNTAGQQGFLLNRHMVYSIITTRGEPVRRRYSEFVFVWDCLVRRYPFRIIPALPPKRIGPDANFLEQRRRGLARCINFVINHPVIKDDGLLSVFLSEPSFEDWRKHTPISMEEESTTKRIDSVEEMTIPSDLEDKLSLVRAKLNVLIEQWQRICLITERLVKRRESAAADLSRMTMTLNALVEENGACWRGAECELCRGVGRGLEVVSGHVGRAADMEDQRMRAMSTTTLEALKAQRDLYMATRELFSRHDRLSGDQVDRIKKRVEASSLRLESVKSAQKEGWAEEADRIISAIEKDQAMIGTCLARRVFIRHCMWHELRVVMHNRENTLLTQAVRAFAREERDFVEGVRTNWEGMAEGVEGMPLE